MGIHRLRRIQEHIIPLILNTDQDLVVSARTGNGKTCKFSVAFIDGIYYFLIILVGYLISVIQKCVEHKRRTTYVQRKPKAAILLQNHETAQQVYEMANKIAQDLELFIIPAIGSNNMMIEMARLKMEGGDLVVGTTGRFVQYISENKV